MLALLLMAALPAPSLSIDWQNNRLTLVSDAFPGGVVNVWYLEAFCRNGAHDREWEQTVIPHETKRLGKPGPAKRIRLRSLIDGKAEATHDLRVVADGVRMEVSIRNLTQESLGIEWAQPCMQVAAFTGRTQQDYIERCFIYTSEGRILLSDLPRNEEARYRGGQVFVPRGVPPADVNPRPISSIVPAENLIGCFSADGKWVLGMAWDQTEELFQGVIVCIHSDFRVGGLLPGETKRLRGRIYLLPNGPQDALLKAYRRDFGRRRN